jgi:hypothetical protein
MATQAESTGGPLVHSNSAAHRTASAAYLHSTSRSTAMPGTVHGCWQRAAARAVALDHGRRRLSVAPNGGSSGSIEMMASDARTSQAG